jgi:hypothetical protein
MFDRAFIIPSIYLDMFDHAFIIPSIYPDVFELEFIMPSGILNMLGQIKIF